MKKVLCLLLVFVISLSNQMVVFAKEDTSSLIPTDPKFDIDTENVTVTYPNSNTFEYDGNEKVYEPSFSDVYQKLYSVKNTHNYSIDTGVKASDTNKAIAYMKGSCLSDESGAYYIGVGNYGNEFEYRIGVGVYSYDIPGASEIVFGVCLGQPGSEQYSGIIDGYDNFLSKDRAYALSFNNSTKDIVFTNSYDDNAVSFKNSLTSFNTTIYDTISNLNVFVGGSGDIYIVKIIKNNGNTTYLFPARKLTTQSGTRKWVYGLYNDSLNDIASNAVTNGTTFSYISGSFFDKYTVLKSLISNSDSSKKYGSSNEVPVKRKNDSKIGYYNLSTNTFSEVSNVSADVEDDDIFRYEGTTRATDPGEYKCKTVLSSLGKAMGLTLSDTNEHTWYIKTIINKPTLSSYELTYDEGNTLLPTVIYNKAGDSSLMTIVDKDTNAELIGYQNVGTYSLKASLNNTTIYSWEDYTTEDVTIEWKIVPKDIDKPVISTVAYLHSGDDIKTEYKPKSTLEPTTYNNLNNHIAVSTYDSKGNTIDDLNKIGIYKQTLHHDTNTKWDGIDVSDSDFATYYCAVYDDYMNLTADSQNDDMKDALLTVAEKTISDEKIAMWVSSENAITNVELEDSINELNDTIRNDKYAVSKLLDIKVYKELNYEEPSLCAELNNEIELSIDLPAELRGKDDIKLYRYHDGTIDEIDIVVENNRIKFSSDKFSIFAVCAPQPPESSSNKKNRMPNTGVD